MAEMTSGSRPSITQLILVPAVITLAITILRLVGELQHWSRVLFNPSAGGGAAVVGIAWLPFILGPYFALKLAGAGERPASAGKAIGFSILGIAVAFGGSFLGFAPQINFPGKLLVGLLLIAAAAALQIPAWPAFAKTLLAYGYAARIPVAIVMFFAIQGNWGTHYDVLPPGYKGPMDFWGKYMFIAFVPQMVFWVAYTVLMGALIGTIALAIARRGKPAPVTT